MNLSEEIIAFNIIPSLLHWDNLAFTFPPLVRRVFSLFANKWENSEKLFLLSPVLRRRPAYQHIYRMFHVFFVRVTIRPELNCLEQDDEVLVREIEK